MRLCFVGLEEDFPRLASLLLDRPARDVHAEALVGDVLRAPRPACFVSSTDSLGCMLDGGVNGAYDQLFPAAQAEVQRAIGALAILNRVGEPYLPVGSALATELADGSVLLTCPTAYRAQDVRNTANARHAMLAALSLWMRHFRHLPLVCPALCVGSGRMPVPRIVAQLREALDHCLADHAASAPTPVKSDGALVLIGPNHDDEQPRVYMNRHIMS